jgi:arsenate reductase
MHTLSGGRVIAYSAGSHPKGNVHPLTISTLQHLGLPVDGLRSKSWTEFASPDAPALDFILTVCDDAAGEICPVWPGKPMTAHWGVADPAACTGSATEQHHAFLHAALQLRQRIELFLSLPLATLDRMTLQAQLKDIGQR